MKYRPEIVLITGATQGLGLTLAQKLSNEGVRIILLGRNVQALKTAQRSLKPSLFGEHVLIAVDLQKADLAVRIQRELKKKKIRHIDWIFHSAGINHNGQIKQTRFEHLRRVFEVNVFALVPLAQVILPFLENSKRPHFILVSSLMSKVAMPGRGAYAASKIAVEYLFESLDLESKTEHFKTRFQILRPASFLTQFHENGFNDGKSPRSNISTMSVSRMADEAILLAQSNKRIRAPGKLNRLIAYIARHFPRLMRLILWSRYRKIKRT